MGFFDNSIFGIDITGDGKADMFDDAVILAALEEEEEESYRETTYTGRQYGEKQPYDVLDEEDEAVASGTIDEDWDF